MNTKSVLWGLPLGLMVSCQVMAATACPLPSDIGWYLKRIKQYQKTLVCSFGVCNFVPPNQRYDGYIFTQAGFKYTKPNVTRPQAENSFFMDGNRSTLDNPNISWGTCKYDVTNQVDSKSCSQTNGCHYTIGVRK